MMTDNERQMLQDMHRALMEVPPGSPADERPLVEQMRVVCRAYQRGNWVVRAAIWVLPALAGVGVAIEKIREWFNG